MSRRRPSPPPRCRNCGALIVFFRSAHTGAWRPFEPGALDGRNPGPRPAQPVEGIRAWKFDQLVEDLMIRRGCLRSAAEDEAYDMAWHVPHACHHHPATEPEETTP